MDCGRTTRVHERHYPTRHCSMKFRSASLEEEAAERCQVSRSSHGKVVDSLLWCLLALEVAPVVEQICPSPRAAALKVHVLVRMLQKSYAQKDLRGCWPDLLKAVSGSRSSR